MSSREHIPTAIGDVHYLDHAAIDTECSDFRASLDKLGNPFVEPFLTAPSPGIVAAALRNDHYPTEIAYLAPLGGVSSYIGRHRLMRIQQVITDPCLSHALRYVTR